MKHISELAILVVDDQPIIDEFCRKVLEKLGCKWVYSALNGKAAAQLLADRGDINLVLTDIDMQPGNGLELLQAIRCGDIPNTPRDLCVLVVTDYNYRHNVMKAVGLDCHGFLSKPLNAAILAERIHAALHRHITLAPVETYRRISTEVRLIPKAAVPTPAAENPVATADPELSAEPTFAAPPKVAAPVITAEPLPAPQPLPEPKAPSKPAPAPLPNTQPEHNPEPEPTPASAPAPPANQDEVEEQALEAAVEALLPPCVEDSFLLHKQEQVREILQLLSHIGKALHFASKSELLALISELEQLSSELFQQEFLHQREHGYQALSAHQAEHGLILQRSQMLAGKLQNHSSHHLIKAYQQLRQAWYRHLTGKDRQYVHFLNERGFC